ncbi:MAG TPA: single-stranded DNA-binding protein [Phycisphaerae bacterium]|nr:single-stranded DNA-binding protein [Phycisphaerae bacterium]
MAARTKQSQLARITTDMVKELSKLSFSSPVEYVYNPLIYARASFDAYVACCDIENVEVILLGMNPGPWGMAQTGVPFGEVGAVRDWLKIDAVIGSPKEVHPKRPVLGLDCHRSEVSGARLWGWAKDTFKTPKRFLKRFFLCNYCPLIFLEDSGRNRTPDKLPATERTPLLEICDRALQRTIDLIEPKRVIGVGAFAQKRAETVLEGGVIPVGGILHPSPASPIANRGWATQANKQFAEQGIRLPKS